MSKHVIVSLFPRFAFCDREARYDGKTRMGPWANMCGGCFVRYGVGLGTGKGQELIQALPGVDLPKTRQKGGSS